MLLGLALFSCHNPKTDFLPRAMREQDRFARYARAAQQEDGQAQEGGEDPLAPQPDVYATAVVFPDTISWRQGDTRKARLILFLNGKPLGGLFLGERPDPERHRFQAGHVWTDSTDGRRTFIARDGIPCFDYEGEERLQGFRVDGDLVHTLGQRPGGGVSYRQNGQEIFSSPSSMILGTEWDPDWEAGAFSADSSGVTYTIGLPVSSETDVLWNYLVMREGETLDMLPAQDQGRVFDVRVHRGSVYRLEQRDGQYCLAKENELFPLDFEKEPYGLKLALADGQIMVKGYEYLGREPRYFLQPPDAARYFYDGPRYPMYNLFVDGGKMYFVLMDHEGCVHSVHKGEQTLALFPLETYRLQTPRCVALKKGVFALALTHDIASEHLILIGEKQYPLTFNGYFTGIYIE